MSWEIERPGVFAAESARAQRRLLLRRFENPKRKRWPTPPHTPRQSQVRESRSDWRPSGDGWRLLLLGWRAEEGLGLRQLALCSSLDAHRQSSSANGADWYRLVDDRGRTWDCCRRCRRSGASAPVVRCSSSSVRMASGLLVASRLTRSMRSGRSRASVWRASSSRSSVSSANPTAAKFAPARAALVGLSSCPRGLNLCRGLNRSSSGSLPAASCAHPRPARVPTSDRLACGQLV
jgi:hypothetical protein